MKKLHTILSFLLVFTIMFLYTPISAQQKTADKKTETKADKKEVKKVPVKKTNDKKSKAK